MPRKKKHEAIQTGPVKYKDAKPFTPRPCSAWLVTLPPNRKRLILASATMSFECMHEMVAREHPRFSLTQVWIADYEVRAVKEEYLPDARAVDHDWNVIPTGLPVEV